MVIPTERLIAIAGLWAFLALGQWYTQKAKGQVWPYTVWASLLAGLVTARVAHVIENWSAFQGNWGRIIAFWQGGFSFGWGLAGAATILLVLTRLSRAGGVLLALMAACSALAFVLLRLTTPAPVPLPEGIELTSLDGTSVRLEDYRGQPVVINLWASWCGPCRREMPMMMEVAKTSSTPVLFLNQGESSGTVRAYLEAEGLSDKNVVLDPFKQVGMALTQRAMPTTLFVDATGMVKTTHVGEISQAILVAGISGLDR